MVGAERVLEQDDHVAGLADPTAKQGIGPEGHVRLARQAEGHLHPLPRPRSQRRGSLVPTLGLAHLLRQQRPLALSVVERDLEAHATVRLQDSESHAQLRLVQGDVDLVHERGGDLAMDRLAQLTALRLGDSATEPTGESFLLAEETHVVELETAPSQEQLRARRHAETHLDL